MAYSTTVVATGGIKTYSSLVVSGALPAGLLLNAGTGVISGTPTAAGSSFTLKVTDKNLQSGTGALSISVRPKPTITTAGLPVGEVGVAYQAYPVVGGGITPYTWSIVSGALPPGLSLNVSTGAISGTPTTSGSSSFTLSSCAPENRPKYERVTLSPVTASAPKPYNSKAARSPRLCRSCPMILTPVPLLTVG